VTNAARRGRHVLTTVPADFSSLRGLDWSNSGLKVLDRTAFSQAGLLRRLLTDAGEYDAVLLNGSGRIDQIAAALLVARRSLGHVVISDCTWQRGTWWLDRLVCRAGIKAIDSPRVTYCVLSSDELALFPRTWKVDPVRVVFTPFCYTLTEAELAASPAEVGGVFAGGDSMRDYAPLLAVAKTIPATVTLAVKRLAVAQRDLPSNIHARPVSHERFVDLMRHAAVVVVPLRAGLERSAGQQTYLNAMALGKIVIATDSPGVRDYIEDGSTGLIVPPGDERSLASALSWALDPSHRREVAEIGASARAAVRSRFRPVDHLRKLIEVVDEVATRSKTKRRSAPVADRLPSSVSEMKRVPGTAVDGQVRDNGRRAGTGARWIERVSIIVPMLNEETRVEGLLADIAAQRFAGELELLVADGGSSDHSVERLRAAASRNRLALTLIENRHRFIPHALNACIRRARGDLVVRMDCRARYPHDYLQRCIAAAEETGAWNVGGLTVPVGQSRVERTVACVADNPFGGIGWTRRATARGRVEVDTVYCGAFRREVFERVGFFDESLPRNEDEDFNFRLRQAGGSVILDPRIKVFYTPRDSAAGLFTQYYGYGRGKVDLIRKHRQTVSLRSMVPLAFVGSVATLAAASIRSRPARRLLAAEGAVYAGCSLGFGHRAIVRRGESLHLLPSVAAIFPVLHVAYGVGMLRGLASILGMGSRSSRAESSQEPSQAPGHAD